MKKMKKLCLMLCVVIATISVLSGCTGGQSTGDSSGDKSAVKNIRWYMPIGSNADNTKVFEKASELLKEKIGVGFDIIPLEFANYESKIQVLNASAETFDLMFTSNWANNYYNNVSKEILVDLSSYLQEDFKDLYNALPDYMWKASEVNGKIYAVPNQQIAARMPFIYAPAQNAELLGFDTNLFHDGMNYKEMLDACETYLRLVKKKENTYTSLPEFWNGTSYYFGMEEIIGSSMPGVIRYNSNEPTKVINQYESEEFKYYINLRRKWVKEGLTQQDISSERQFEISDDKVIPVLTLGATYRPGIEPELDAAHGFKTQILMKTNPVLTSGGIIATMTGISVTSKMPEKAMETIRLLNTDKELYNLLSFGIEGLNYTKTGENRIEPIAEHTYSSSNWAIGSVFNSYIQPGQDDDVWVQTKEINDSAFRSPLLGFSPQTENLNKEIAACQSIIDEFLKGLDNGVSEDGTYEKFIQKLKTAGCDKIIEELQHQVDTWLTQTQK